MKKIAITTENAGLRLDKFLASSFAKASEDKKEFFSLSRGNIIKQIKEGKVLVNGKIEKPSYVIREGDGLEIGLVENENALFANEKVSVEVLYENEDFVVINKPAGIQVHPGHLNEKDTLTNWLVAKYPDVVDVHDESAEAWMRPGIVHRLDKETSGVMVVAKNIKSYEELKKAFKQRTVEKTYLAIVSGILENEEGVIDLPIARSTTYRKQVIARNNTKTTIRDAVTNYELLGEYENLSIVKVMPKTGRMHQIRIHFSAIGHPVLGDVVYGISKDLVGSEKMAKRQLLHAWKLEFGLFGSRYAFIAPIPEDFALIVPNIDEIAH